MSYDFEVPVRKKRKDKKSETITLEVGQKVRYVFFSNITFEGIDEKGAVILKDKSGNIKLVNKNLFQKYVEVE